jgi:hypothetical protein
MQVVTLSQGCIAVVDDQDYERVMKHKWSAVKFRESNGFYAMTNVPDPRFPGKTTTLSMHVFIMQPPENMMVDHIHGNTLDNRRSQLRVCTPAENSANRQKYRREGLTSKYKGVGWKKGANGWLTQCRFNKSENRNFGLWQTEEAAALAYNYAARKSFGEFARINQLDMPKLEIIREEMARSPRLPAVQRRVMMHLEVSADVWDTHCAQMPLGTKYEKRQIVRKPKQNFFGLDSIVPGGLRSRCLEMVRPDAA